MKTIFALILFLSANVYADWSHPALLFPEESLPHGRDCLDLSLVQNPQIDFPSDFTEADIRRWNIEWSKDLKVCRAQEVLRRESAQPGSFSALQIQISWMISNGGEHSAQKLQAIVTAAQANQMPVHVLIGALTQESLLASLGVSSDGGNYSCGIGQLNITEWCLGMQSLPASEREKYGWPAGLACEGGSLTSDMVAPFYRLAIKKLNGRPEYRLDASDFAGIGLADVITAFPHAEAALQNKRFQAITAFVSHCQNAVLGIAFKARNLKALYDRFVPTKLKTTERYTTT